MAAPSTTHVRRTLLVEHRIRRRLFDALEELPYDIWLNVELLLDTTDE